MTCCIACFEWNTSEDNRHNSAPQGHTYCRVPTEEEKIFFLRGCRPIFQNNRWRIEKMTAEERKWTKEVSLIMAAKQEKWAKANNP